MPNHQLPVAILAAEVPARTKPSVYPEPFASRMAGRERNLWGQESMGSASIQSCTRST